MQTPCLLLAPAGASLARRVFPRSVKDVQQLREVLGGRRYDEAVMENRRALDRLGEELARSEVRAAPLRRRLQSSNRAEREGVRVEMDRIGLTETDLCSAWHHLPRERRGWIAEMLGQLDSRLFCEGEIS